MGWLPAHLQKLAPGQALVQRQEPRHVPLLRAPSRRRRRPAAARRGRRARQLEAAAAERGRRRGPVARLRVRHHGRELAVEVGGEPVSRLEGVEELEVGGAAQVSALGLEVKRGLVLCVVCCVLCVVCCVLCVVCCVLCVVCCVVRWGVWCVLRWGRGCRVRCEVRVCDGSREGRVVTAGWCHKRIKNQESAHHDSPLP